MAKVLLKYLSTSLLRRINALSRQVARREEVTLRRHGADDSLSSGLDQFANTTTGVVNRSARSEASLALHAVLEELDDADREVLILRSIEQRSNAEVAELVGHSESSVSKRFNRGLEKLRQKLPESMLNELLAP